MKAAQISDYGGPEVIKVTTDAVEPNPTPDQVLVEVHAASLNPFDTMVRAGYVAQMVPPFPVTLGGDIAGVITKVGPNVSGIAVGDEVYGQAAVVAGNSGALAELAATKASQVAKKPSNLDFQQAAALPLVGVSAIQALTEHLNLQSGQKILIHGGTGGIGSIAVQLAKHLGAYVATTVSTEDIQAAIDLGADEVIDFKTQKFEEVIRDYDAVFDTAGGDVFEKSLPVLKKGGTAVTMIAEVNEAKAEELGITAIHQGTQVNSERLTKLTELVEQGIIKPAVGQVFPLDEIQAAFTARESGAKGKIVLAIK